VHCQKSQFWRIALRVRMTSSAANLSRTQARSPAGHLVRAHAVCVRRERALAVLWRRESARFVLENTPVS
jgi:hypothetical protein